MFEPSPNEVIRVTFVDRVLQYTVLLFIPKSVHPNHLTALRFVLTPFVIGLLYLDFIYTGTVLFIVAALTDAIDGAMARTRNQITEWGKTLDPLADKLLVGGVIVILAGKYVGIGIAIAIIVIEILLIASATYMKEFKGKPIQAQWAGKIKMILQSVGIGAILVFALTGLNTWFFVAQGAFYLAIFFALLSLLVYRSV
jgi:CDP-diacylglycerol---glycerol-3-phosphate 3-phosphatidyltransferase